MQALSSSSSSSSATSSSTASLAAAPPAVPSLAEVESSITINMDALKSWVDTATDAGYVMLHARVEARSGRRVWCC